ncbi:hypothetical protein AKO1_008491 [Acrasis kona]|uniref:Guanylate cyclase domain-containing protein n=1 Tax=Acrasis kona TaxID=1008807 RepID=A0AAW2YM80_9EUKA
MSSKSRSNFETDMFAIGIEQRCSVLMVVSMVGETLTTEHIDSDISSYVSYHGRVLTALMRAINKYKGQIDTFSSNQFVVSFQVGRNSNARAINNACLAAVYLHNSVKEFSEDPNRLLYEANKPDILITIASGIVLSGNMGNKNKRLMCSFGPLHTLSEAMNAVNNQSLFVKIMVNDEIFQLVQHKQPCRPIASICIEEPRQEPVYQCVYELMICCDVGDDEWMYELDRENKRDVQTNFENGFLHAMQQNWSEAVENFEKYVMVHPQDGLSMKMLKKCQSCLVETPASLPFQYKYKKATAEEFGPL